MADGWKWYTAPDFGEPVEVVVPPGEVFRVTKPTRFAKITLGKGASVDFGGHIVIIDEWVED